MKSIIEAQIADYPLGHATRANLLIHILAVPLFWIGLVATLVSIVQLDAISVLLGAAMLAISIALQGVGHRREGERPKPFASPWEFAARIVSENLYVFPRFVLNGGWARAWAAGVERST
jgi:uncharacterized membrane protein YGL010W